MSSTVERVKPANILVVDDTPANLEALAAALRQSGHEVRPFPSGKQALQAAQKDPPDLILLSVDMPDMNGYEVCRRLKAEDRLKDIPVIFCGAPFENSDGAKGFAVGAADTVASPLRSEEVRARVETHLKLRRLQAELEERNRYVEAVKETLNSQMATIFALAKLSESRDEDTGRHLDRVQVFCRLLATRLAEERKYRGSIGESFVENIFTSAPVHDVGKMAIPDAILLKPERLTPLEFELMKRHTVIGAYTLGLVREQYPQSEFISLGVAIARSHHERWDGSGYPDRLSGEQIPLAARIMSIADVYDTLRSKRCYKPALSHEEACVGILKGSGGYFDPIVREVFVELQGEFAAIWQAMPD